MPYPIVVPDAVAAVLRVTGEDAFAYLQSQFSADLRPALGASGAVYGLFLSRKGRVEADAIVAVLSSAELLLISYHTTVDVLIAKVMANVVADDVEIEPLGGGSLTVAGSGSAAALAAAGLPVPEPGRFFRSGGALVVRGRRCAESFEIVYPNPADAGEKCLRLINTSGDVAELESLRIGAGIPRVPEDCGPGDLPQEAGLGEEAVAYDKGCYLGQEVMARLKAQGRPTRTLTRVILPACDAPVSLPAALWAGGSECGAIRSRANVDGACVAFAMLRDRVSSEVDTFSLSPSGEPSVRRDPNV